jgi:hypothetical protein
MIYVVNITEIIPGKMAEYKKLAEEMAVVNDRLGSKRVLAMQSYSGNMNQLITIFAYNDLAEMQKNGEKNSKDKDVQRLIPLMNALRVSSIRNIFEPVTGRKQAVS